MTLLLSALLLCILGVLASIVVPAAFGRTLGFLSLGAAGVCVCVAALMGFHAAPTTVAFGSPEMHLLLRLDPIAAFFIGILGVVCVLVAIFALGPRTADERRSGRTASASACAIALASLLVCCANDVLLFIFAWELLALTFFWAVAFAGTDSEAPRAAYVTIVVTHVAGACIVGTLLFLAHSAGSYTVDTVVAAGRTLAPPSAGLVLLLLLVGFGAKFGMLPMQVWLPYGYRSAPSLVAALMAGGALNVGFYGVTRFIVGFSNAPAWFAVVTIALGAITAFFGIVWAVAQHDIRRLAAFSSVENGGIILAAFGVAIAAGTLHNSMLAGFALAAAFVQIVAHALAKCTLFLSASAIVDGCSTASFEELGGLARSMPIVTIVTLVCALSLAALPPMAGFAGEWLVLELLMQAFRTGNVAYEVTFALAGALIGVAAGVAVVTFTKLVGIGLLGAPRSQHALDAKQTHSPWRLTGLVLGALAIVFGGIFAAPLLNAIAPSIDGIAGAPAVAAMIGTFPLVQPAFAGFSSLSPLGLGCVILSFTGIFWIITRCFARPRGHSIPTWTSGEPYRPWTQYTGTGYANPTRVILDVSLRTVREIESDHANGTRRYASGVRPFFDLAFYRSLAQFVLRIGDVVRMTQSGIIAAYLSYILAFTILLLMLFPSIRHW